MSYEIEVREVWYVDDHGSNASRWDWFVYDEEMQLLDQGSTKFGLEHDARRAAEKAATLFHKQQNAKVVRYDFTPE